MNFARAIVCEPDLLLLDEPFSALDYGIKKKIQKEFLEIIRGKNITTVFVTHDLDEARVLADRIMLFPTKKGQSLREVSRSDQLKLESYFETYEKK